MPSGAALPPLSLPSTTGARGTSQDQAVVGVLTESSANVSSAAAVVSAAHAPQKRDIGTAKAQADKKKLDARKKSLKRLWWSCSIIKPFICALVLQFDRKKEEKQKQKKRGEGEGIWVMGEIELLCTIDLSGKEDSPLFYYYSFFSQIDLYN